MPKSVIHQARHKLHELESATPVAAGESRPAPVTLARNPILWWEELAAVRPGRADPAPCP